MAVGAVALHGCQPMPPGAVRIRLDGVPPDACLELFGPGPCRPHGGMPTTGWTDPVAGPLLAGEAAGGVLRTHAPDGGGARQEPVAAAGLRGMLLLAGE